MEAKNEQKIEDAINTLGRFCGKRDLEQLTSKCLLDSYQMNQADVMVLFGGSIMCGGDVLAEAIKNQIAKYYVIVGGAGHTTETLRIRVHKDYPEIETTGLSEAEVFSKYIDYRYHLKVDALECKSTNCGNNITYLLDLLKEKEVPCRSIILCQDATMQLRMSAGLRKYVEDDMTIINYASYQAEVITDAQNEELVYQEDIYGMWDMERYVNLLMGEIPRLTDDVNGYGPKGKGFIAHIDIPKEVLNAFEMLKKEYGEQTREANPLFASK